MSNNNKHWDVFCKIVDNYGDIGVCWRLSQQLAHEYNLQVRLFIDDISAAKKIISFLDCAKQSQTINDVEVRIWPELKNSAGIKPADVILETFSCELPDFYIQKMLVKNSIWLNLEYLSAENWVSDFHAKPSPHPTLAITKHYFFPGFKNDTGGLIRETDLTADRDEFTSSKDKQSAFWQRLGINKNDLINEKSNADTIKISLFCYPQAGVYSLISALVTANQPLSLFIPNSDSITSFINTLADIKHINSNTLHKENLTIHLLPFLSQSDYDRLLWTCDLNFVRGEDSWVRAIWAGKPFIWQPYIQSDDTHIKKLSAFLDLYLIESTSDIKSTLVESHLAWSNSNPSEAELDPMPFTRLIKHLPELQTYAKQQTNNLAAQPDLATKLVIFSENLAKNNV